jgi:phage nucleotide-binding protein
MALIKKPSEIEAKKTISMLVYGQPGLGKTTLACSAPAPVLFDYDGGVGRIHGSHRIDTVQIRSWEDTNEAMIEVRDAGCYKTIIIDTVGKMLDHVVEYIRNTQPTYIQRDGSLSLKGYGLRKQMFTDFIRNLQMMGLNVIFVAHEKEEKQGDLTVKRADAGTASNANDLFKDLDLVGYMSALGKDRTISFDPHETYYAKNTCNLEGLIKIPVLVDAKGNTTSQNTFLSNVVFAKYYAYQNQSNELSKEYNLLIEKIKEDVEKVVDADSANAFVESITAIKHIYDSKVIAQNLFKKKVDELKLTYDKSKKTYVAKEEK